MDESSSVSAYHPGFRVMLSVMGGIPALGGVLAFFGGIRDADWVSAVIGLVLVVLAVGIWRLAVVRSWVELSGDGRLTVSNLVYKREFLVTGASRGVVDSSSRRYRPIEIKTGADRISIIQISRVFDNCGNRTDELDDLIARLDALVGEPEQ